MRSGFKTLLAAAAVLGLSACTLTIPPPPRAPRGSADEIALFLDVSERAGIQARHEATWNQFGEEGAEAPFDTGYMAMGQAWGDYDRDGWPDLYVTGNRAPNALYRNQQDGTFALSAFNDQVAMPDAQTGGAM